MRDSFDVVAMKIKIAKNQVTGWTVEAIRKELLREKVSVLTSMSTLEERAMELSDQIEFIENEYGKQI